MVLKGLLSKVTGVFGRAKAAPVGDPRLVQALAAAEAAEAHILSQFPDGDIPPEAQAQLDKVAEMRSLTQDAMAAEADNDLETLLNVADKVNNTPRSGPLDQIDADDMAIFEAIDAGDVAAIEEAVQHQDVNGTYGPDGLTPLTFALARTDPNLQVLLALFEAGADAAATAAMGGTALSPLAFGRYDAWGPTEVYELTKALVALGADLEARDDAGLTPVQRAVFNQNAPITEALLRCGADANATFPEDVAPDFLFGMTPLHAAVMDPDLARLLVNYGADQAACNADGETAAEYAAMMLDDDVAPEEATWLKDTIDLLQQGQAA